MGWVAKQASKLMGGDQAARMQARQAEELRRREAQAEAAAEGQRRARGGRRGLLAYADDTLSRTTGG